MAQPSNETSLHRFLRTRGYWYLGNYGRVGFAIHIGLGVAMGVLGLGFALAPLFGAGQGVAAGAIGPIIGGAANVVTGFFVRRKAQEQGPPVELSREAKDLLRRLVRRAFGWRGPHTGPSFLAPVEPMAASQMSGGRMQVRRTARRAMVGSWLSGLGESHPPLPESVHDVLERAAFHYNRLQAVVASGSANLTKMTPRLTAAADEAMAEVLHHGGVVTKFPEGSGSALARANERVGALDELASRVERVALQGVTANAAPSHLDGVLEELRLEALARDELRTDTASEQEQRA